MRPNVILEYGILLGLDKPIIALKDKEACINVESLYLTDGSKQKVKKIGNPALNIDKHLSDVKDLHWTSYDWREPDGFKKVLEDAFIKIKDKILDEITKRITTKEISAQKPEIYNEFQEAFKELAEYTIKLRKSDYNEIMELDKKINTLSENYNIQLSSNYYFDLGYIYGELFKYDEALKAYDKAIEIKHDFAVAWYNKACAYSLKGDKQNALRNLVKAIELDIQYKEKAKKDEDFKNLWDDKDFKRIVE